MAEVLPALTSGFRIEPVAVARFGIALAQGIALALLFHVVSRNWSPDIAPISVPLALVLLTAPLILIQGWSVIPRGALWRWAAFAAVCAAGLGLYDAWRRSADAMQVFPRDARASIPLTAGVVAALFVGQAFLAARASDG